MRIIKLFLGLSFFLISLLLLNYAYLDFNTPKLLKDYKKIEIFDEEENLLYESISGVEKSWLDLKEVPPLFLDVLIFSEDKRFYRHSGFDVLRIIKSSIKNLNKNSLEGASTISQQLARTLFLDNDKTFARKTKELYYSVYLDSRFSKQEILESYFNNIFIGHGIYGFPKAASYFYNKEISNLSLSEFLMLLNSIKNPTHFSPILNYKQAIEAKNSLAEFLFKKKIIKRIQLDQVINDNNIEITSTKNNKNGGVHYFIDYILSEVKNKEKYHLKKKINHLKIYTPYSLRLANYINENIGINSDLEISVTAIEPYTGKIKALIGGKDYSSSSFNRAIDAKRQIGSTIKPFIYYTALEKGFTPLTSFVSEKTSFHNNDIIYTPKNYNDSYDNKKITMAYALATSDNIYAVKTLDYLGQNNFSKTLNKINFSTSNYNLTLALGSNNESLFSLTNAYNILASEGKSVKPVAITAITENAKKVYKDTTNKSLKSLLEADSVFILNDLLTGTFDSSLNQRNHVTGELVAKSLKNKYAAKSGLTDTDSYIIGFNPFITIGIWVGYDDNKPLFEKEDLRLAKTLWAKSVEEYMTGKEASWYDLPDNIIIKESRVTDNYLKDLYFKI